MLEQLKAKLEERKKDWAAAKKANDGARKAVEESRLSMISLDGAIQQLNELIKEETERAKTPDKTEVEPAPLA